MTRVANSMTDKLMSTKERQDKRTEKIQVERDMHMEKKIAARTEHILLFHECLLSTK
jgi:hypothetical protein